MSDYKQPNKGDTMKYALMIALLTLTACGRGPAGLPGKDGQSIQGERGEAGEDGTDAVLEVIDPCGDAPGVVDEILLRLADGRVLCSFSANASGQNTRLAILPAGSYVTTDGSSCHFTVTVNGTIQ